MLIDVPNTKVPAGNLSIWNLFNVDVGLDFVFDVKSAKAPAKLIYGIFSGNMLMLMSM